MKRTSLKLLIVLALAVPSNLSFAAGILTWAKGCVILGGASVGGTVLATSNSNAELQDSQALIVSGVTGCIIGGFLSQDITRRAELKAEAELQEANRKLKHGVYGVMHDLCVMKGECGPDGLPLNPNNDKNSNSSKTSIKSGN